MYSGCMDTPQHGSILPEGMNPEGLDIKKQAAHRYAAIHIEQPFDNPFSTIPGAYHTLGDYMRTVSTFLESGFVTSFSLISNTSIVRIYLQNSSIMLY